MLLDLFYKEIPELKATFGTTEKEGVNAGLLLLPEGMINKFKNDNYNIVPFLDRTLLKKYVGDDSLPNTTVGLFDYEKKNIYLYIQQGKETLKNIIVHEFGHYIDYVGITGFDGYKSEKSNVWKTLLDSEGKVHLGNDSHYVANVKEYHSWAFATYFLNKTELDSLMFTKNEITKEITEFNSVNERLKALETNCINYLEYDINTNKIKFNRMNEKTHNGEIQLKNWNTEVSGGDSSLIYDSTLNFDTKMNALTGDDKFYYNLIPANVTQDGKNLTGYYIFTSIKSKTNTRVAYQKRKFIVSCIDSDPANSYKLIEEERYYDSNAYAWGNWVETNVNNNTSSTASEQIIGERLLAHYVHSGNKEIHFSDFNFETGEGTTSEPHGIETATEILIAPNDWGLEKRNNNCISIPIEWVKNTDRLKVVPVDDVTLKLTKNDGTTIIAVKLDDVSNAKVDITKFHFEIPKAWTIINLPYDTKNIRIMIKGYIKSGHDYRYINWWGKDTTNKEVNQVYLNLLQSPSLPSGSKYCVFGAEEWTLDFRDGLVRYNVDSIFEGRRPGYNYIVWESSFERTNKLFDLMGGNIKTISKIGSYSDGRAYNSNGTHVYIYDRGGNK